MRYSTANALYNINSLTRVNMSGCKRTSCKTAQQSFGKLWRHVGMFVLRNQSFQPPPRYVLALLRDTLPKGLPRTGPTKHPLKTSGRLTTIDRAYPTLSDRHQRQASYAADNRKCEACLETGKRSRKDQCSQQAIQLSLQDRHRNFEVQLLLKPLQCTRHDAS